MPVTFVDGIASSQAIDTAGEIVDINGLDCSSLEGSVYNYEHESKLPSQIVGKILRVKKIFSEKDCETDRHRYYWNKFKIPYLYCLGRLLDDKKASAQEVAAMFKDDAEHPNEQPILGFSVEGAKISANGPVITHSIARRITITQCPANKTCIAELLPTEENKTSNKDSIDDIFKAEEDSENFNPYRKLEKVEALSGVMPSSPAFGRSEDMKKSVHQHGWTPSSTKTKTAGTAIHFSHPLHGTVSVHHNPETKNYEVKHAGTHANLKGKKAIFSSPHEAIQHAHTYIGAIHSGSVAAPKMHNVSSGSVGPKFTKPDQSKSMDKAGEKGVHTAHSSRNPGHSTTGDYVSAAKPNPHENRPSVLANKKAYINTAKQQHKQVLGELKQMPKPNLPKSESMGKAMDAGSAMVAPSALSGTAALSRESLESKREKNKKWLARAEEEYQKWNSRDNFRKFMQDRFPTLAMGEIDAIGQTIALKRSMKAEKNLSKMGATHMGSYVTKKDKDMAKFSDQMMASEKKDMKKWFTMTVSEDKSSKDKKLKKLFPF